MWLPRPRRLGWGGRGEQPEVEGPAGTLAPAPLLFRASAAGASSSPGTSQRPGAQSRGRRGARVSGCAGPGWARARARRGSPGGAVLARAAPRRRPPRRLCWWAPRRRVGQLPAWGGWEGSAQGACAWPRARVPEHVLPLGGRGQAAPPPTFSGGWGWGADAQKQTPGDIRGAEAPGLLGTFFSSLRDGPSRILSFCNRMVFTKADLDLTLPKIYRAPLPPQMCTHFE